MAFNYQDYTPNFSVGETEEERRRREELERQRALAESGVQTQPMDTATGPVAPGVADNSNPYLNLTSQPTDIANTEVQTQTVKTYGDGSQEEITKRQIPSQEVTGPAVPEQANIEEQRRLQQAQAAQAQQAQQMAQPQPEPQPQPQQMAQPAAPAAPVAPQQTQLPQPGPGVQVAGPAQMPPQASSGQGINMPAPAAPNAAPPQMSMQERIAAAAQRAQERAGTAQPGQMPASSVGSLQQVAQQQAAPSFETRFTEASSDISKLDQLRKDETLTKEQRLLAGRQAQDLLTRELGPIKAKEEVANMSEMEIARLLKSKSEEGSWGKLLLLGFVSPTLAAKEAAKLGLNDQWTTTTAADGTPMLLKTRDGVPIEGVNGSTGKKLSAKELVSTAASATGKLNIVGGTYVNDKTGEVGRVVTDEKTGVSYVQTDQGRKSMSGFRPQASAGTLADQLASQQQKAGVGLQYAAPTAAATAGGKIAGETAATFGTPIQQPQQLQVGGAPGVPAPNMPQAPGAAPAPGGAGPVSPAQVAQQAAAAARPAPGVAAPGVSPAGGAGLTPAQLQQRQELGTTAGKANIETNAIVQREKLKPGAAAEGQQTATDVKNQGFADRSYDLMKPINEAILKSTGSTLGAGVDTVAAAIGKSTEGSKAISRLNVLSYGILSNIPRFEGPQSDIDVQMYKQAAGDFANKKAPVEDRLAALDALRSILQRYDKAGKNDWTFGAGQQGSAAAAGTTASGNKYKRVN